MTNEKHNNWSRNGHHPSDDELLRFIDGEDSREETEAVQFHLKACWSCRVRAEKLNEVISTFVEFRGRVIKPAIKIPDNRGNFNLRLNKAAAEIKAESSLFGRLLTQLKNFFTAVKQKSKTFAGSTTTILNSISRSPLFNFLHDDRTRRLLAGSATAVLIFSLLFTYLFWIPSISPVSAEVLLDRTFAARRAQIKNKELPVVYQQIQINHRTASGENSLKAELWQDETYSRVRRTVRESNGSNEVSVGNPNSRANDRLLTGLEEILRTNNFVPAQPFSVSGLRAWRKTLTQKRETVEEDKTADGTDVLRLKTEAVGAGETGKLLSSALTVRSGDYHPVEQLFVVKTADGEEEFFVRETSFAVLSLNSLSPDFFEDKQETILVAREDAETKMLPSPSLSPAESPIPEPDANKSITNNSSPVASVASSELEVDVLQLLHQAGADLGEQVEVVREPNGPVKITGVVDSPERKNQLLNALRPVSRNRAVQINIRTVEEAVAAEQKKSKNQASAPPVVQMETRTIEGISFPAESQVREYFAKQGGGDEAVRQYAARTVNRSAQAMKFLYALKRLKNQMKAGDFEKLAPDARAKLLNLVKSYARSYQGKVAALRRELQPVFGGGAAGGNSVAINSDADLFSAIEQLFDAGAASDQAVSNALATGRGKAGGNSLQAAEFWRNLSSAEAIAERLQNVK